MSEYSEFEKHLLQELTLLRLLIAELVTPLVGAMNLEPCNTCGHPRRVHDNNKTLPKCSMCECLEWWSDT